MRTTPEALEGVVVKDGQIVIYLNRDGAEWLANELPQSDGFTGELWRALYELAKQREAR